MVHKAYLQVQRRQGGRQIRLPRRKGEPAVDAPDHPCSEGIVGDEEDSSFEFAAGNGLGNIVQQGGEAQAAHAVLLHACAYPVLLQLALDAADDLEDMIQGVQVMVLASFQVTGEGELGDDVEEPD